MPEALARTYARSSSPTLDYSQLPDAVTDKLKASLLHAMFVSLVGAQTAHGKAAVELVKEEEANPRGATVLADGARASRSGAAFANSKLMHATNQTDSIPDAHTPRPVHHPGGPGYGGTDRRQRRGTADGHGGGLRGGGPYRRRLHPGHAGEGFPVQPGLRHTGRGGDHRQAVGVGRRPDGDRPGPSLHLRRRHHRGAARQRARDAVPRAQRHPQRNHGRAAGPREPARLRTCLEGDAGFYNAFVGNNRGELSYTFSANPPGDGGPGTTELAATVEGLGDRWELLHVTPKIYPTAGYNCPVIELTTRMRAAHDIAPEDIESITVEMNWLETTYPSPRLPQHRPADAPAWAAPTTSPAYTWTYGSYPPLRQRLDPGIDSADFDRQVMSLQERVEVIGQRTRGSFAPRINRPQPLRR